MTVFVQAAPDAADAIPDWRRPTSPTRPSATSAPTLTGQKSTLTEYLRSWVVP